MKIIWDTRPTRYINLYFANIAYWCNGFWIRLGKKWWGIHCIDKNEKMLFSERNRYTKIVIIGNYRFKVLKPCK